jgi:hypothetical protein
MSARQELEERYGDDPSFQLLKTIYRDLAAMTPEASDGH